MSEYTFTPPPLQPSDLDVLQAQVARLQSNLDRAEAFGASALALSVALLQEMLASERIERGEAINMVSNALDNVRRLYRSDGQDPFAHGSVNSEELAREMNQAAREDAAGELLEGLLKALRQ
ncbi:MAG: hypothetical protein RIB84_08425 [Sneathiellaceae bacterium]